LSALAPETPFDALNWFERFAFRTMRFFNSGLAAPLAYLWQRYALIPFVGLFFTRRLDVRGLERVTALPKDARILLLANHRTFFDLFALGYVLWKRGGLTQRLNFPVRGNFFYEHPLGLFLCVAMSGGTMFPPFFRPVEKKAFNKVSLGILIEKLRTPGQLIGFHPEGTRSKTDDPYTLLPAQPGAGELALKARPYVVPAFITGVSNSIWRELRAGLRGKGKVVAVFGDPVELPEIEGDTRLSHHKKLADQFNQSILALAEEEKAVRRG
jgi:1-acyl-sn-glycerol-3-phosphate acyltransferase